MSTVAVSSSPFPQSGTNRTRNQAISEIADHSGGANRPDVQQTAGNSWDAAVRDYNDTIWRFNRQTQDITITVSTADYTLNSNFRNPVRALTLNTSDKTVDDLIWIDYKDWLDLRSDQSSTGTTPQYYTARNLHEAGLVTFDPPCGTTLPTSTPKVRIHYFSRITTQSGVNSPLDVPPEVDEGIFQMAVAFHLAKILGHGHPDAVTARTLAKQKKALLQDEWRDWADSTAVWG